MNIISYFKPFICENKSKKHENILIKNPNDYELLLKYNFTLSEIKDVIKRFKLPKTKEKTKAPILQHVINCLYLSNKIKKIQKIWRTYFIRQFNKTLGPAFFNRSLSNNVEDFLTTEDVKDIDYYFFFSYKDKDDFIYSFNLVSIYNLISKHIFKNPYNRFQFDESLMELVLKRQKMNIILNKIHKETIVYVPPPLTIQQKILRIFNKIDELGNYTQVEWFSDLRRHELCKFLYELYEIWFYRAQLSAETHRLICPPGGNPFSHVNPNYINYLQHNQGLRFIQEICYVIMDKMLFSANEETNQNLGALYILSALTLVSEPARDAMPWLYASVQY